MHRKSIVVSVKLWIHFWSLHNDPTYIIDGKENQCNKLGNTIDNMQNPNSNFMVGIKLSLTKRVIGRCIAVIFLQWLGQWYYNLLAVILHVQSA